MASPETPTQPAVTGNVREEVRKAVRDDLGKLLVLAAPTFAIQQLLLIIGRWFTDQPWQGVSILVPFVAVSIGVLWWLYRGDGVRPLRGAYLLFFCAYCLAFSFAAGTDLLSWRRTLIGYNDTTPRGFLALNRFGDWRYWLIPEMEEAGDLLVVTIDTAGRSREAVRYDLVRLIRLALGQGSGQVKGIALDFQFVVPSAADLLLCAALQDAEAQGLVVFVGHGHKEVQGVVVRELLPRSLRRCVSRERQGHLAGYLEWDGRVRMIPLFLKSDRQLEALSLRAATYLKNNSGGLKVPDDGLLQFRPNLSLKAHAWRGPVQAEEFGELLRDHFILVGASSQGDHHVTPVGRFPGVILHAWAMQSLRTGQWISRLGPTWSFPGIWLLCYTIMVVWARGAGARRMVTTTIALSALAWVIAALAARNGIWIEVSYPLAAIWPLAGVLLVPFRRRASNSGMLPGGSATARRSALLPGTTDRRTGGRRPIAGKHLKKDRR